MICREGARSGSSLLEPKAQGQNLPMKGQNLSANDERALLDWVELLAERNEEVDICSYRSDLHLQRLGCCYAPKKSFCLFIF